MFNIIRHKKWFFFFSLLIIVPGVISLVFFGLRLSIDFTGGSRISLTSPQKFRQETVQKIEKEILDEGIEVAQIQQNEQTIFFRTTPMTEKQNAKILEDLEAQDIQVQQESFETVGPTIGQETATNAVKAVLFASLLIVLYIAYSFRKVPKPTSSWRFGVTTIFTLVHDVLLLLGLFSIFGVLFGVEIDSLFITALLTVMGFSVHDTIVVFDRIRENLLKHNGEFKSVVNDSILQTLTRSLNTSITALLVLFSLLLFGGTSIFWFVMALFIGVAVGTYSSIFNAAPLLVLWDEVDKKRKGK